MRIGIDQRELSAVDIPQALFDQPVHVRQPAHEPKLRLRHELDRPNADEQRRRSAPG